MKKILLALFSIASLSAAGQVVVPKGSRVIGGNVSIGTGKSQFDTSANGNDVNTSSNYHFGLNPSLGWAKKDNEVYGILIHSSFDRWKSESASSLTKGTFSAVGPGVFYERFFSLGKGFHFSVNGTLRGTYGIIRNKTYTNNTLTADGTGKRWDANFSVTPRIGYAFNKKWMVQASIGELLNVNYNSTFWKTTNGTILTESNYNNFSVNTGLNRGLSLSNIGLTFRYSF